MEQRESRVRTRVSHQTALSTSGAAGDVRSIGSGRTQSRGQAGDARSIPQRTLPVGGRVGMGVAVHADERGGGQVEAAQQRLLELQSQTNGRARELRVVHERWDELQPLLTGY